MVISFWDELFGNSGNYGLNQRPHSSKNTAIQRAFSWGVTPEEYKAYYEMRHNNFQEQIRQYLENNPETKEGQ